MTSFGNIRDSINVDFYPKQTEDDDTDSSDSHLAAADDNGYLARLAPASKLGWFATFVGAIVVLALVRWAWQFIPPFMKTLEFALVLTILISNVANTLLTRDSMLSYWSEFDHVDLYKGETVTPKVGRVPDSDGEDPLFEELVTPGFAGLNPEYRTVDDEFVTENALASKLDRLEDADTGEWEPSRGRLDHAYLGDGSLDYLGQRYVVHCSGVETAPHSPNYEWYTLPPNKPDMDAARKLRDRDYLLRNHVIPTMKEENETMQNRLEKVKNASMDEPILAMNEIPDLMASLYPLLAQQSDDGQPQLAAEPDVAGEIDQAAEDRMEDDNDS